MTVHLSEKCLYLFSYRQEKTGSNLQIYRVKIATIGIDCCGVARVYWGLASSLGMNIQGYMHMFFKASRCFLLKTVLFVRKLGGGKGEILPFFVILPQNQKNFLNRPFFVSVAEAGWKKTLDKGGAGCYSVGKFNHRNR